MPDEAIVKLPNLLGDDEEWNPKPDWERDAARDRWVAHFYSRRVERMVTLTDVPESVAKWLLKQTENLKRTTSWTDELENCRVLADAARKALALASADLHEDSHGHPAQEACGALLCVYGAHIQTHCTYPSKPCALPKGHKEPHRP